MATLTTQAEPLFQENDVVQKAKTKHWPELYAVIMDVDRLYSEIDSNGRLVRGGLNQRESDITNICIPYTFDGDMLTVHYPDSIVRRAHTQQYKFSGYTYTVKSDSLPCLLVCSESSLTLIERKTI